MSIRVTSLKMLLGQGGSHGVGDHILMVLQCHGQRVVERSMNSSLGSKSDMVERLAKSGKKRVWYSSLGVTTHSTHWVSIILLSAIVGRLEEVPSQEGSILPCGRK